MELRAINHPHEARGRSAAQRTDEERFTCATTGLRRVLFYRVPLIIARSIGPGILAVGVQDARLTRAIACQANCLCVSAIHVQRPQAVVAEITVILVGETSVLCKEEEIFRRSHAQLDNGVCAAKEHERRAPQSWFLDNIAGTGARVSAGAMREKHLLAIEAAIKILQ